MSRRFIDLTGEKIGSWLVVSYHGIKNGSEHWNCKCNCGTIAIVSGSTLRRGKSLRCKNCHLSSGKAHLQHGMTGTPTYKSWLDMIARCTKENNKSWMDYGGRGIRVHEPWLDFKIFLRDVGICPSGLTLERINNDGNYEPGNVIWATRKVQANNRRERKRKIKHDYSWFFA